MAEQIPQIPDALDWLRAENETAWLSSVYVEPPKFTAMLNTPSIVIYGDPGSGKTALANEFVTRARQRPIPPLVLQWQPEFPLPDKKGSEAAVDFLEQILAESARVLARGISRNPGIYQNACEADKNSARQVLSSFLGPESESLLSRLVSEASPDGIAVITQLLRQDTETWRPGTTLTYKINMLVEAVRGLRMSGVWIMVDNLDPWLQVDAERFAAYLLDLFSYLAMFENKGFAMKVFAPTSLRSVLVKSSGEERRRVATGELTWPERELFLIAEKRLDAIFGVRGSGLSGLCKDDRFKVWLAKCSGRSPRGWLELLQLIREAQVEVAPDRPLTEDEWVSAWRRSPPRLYVDPQSKRVFIGHGEITDIQPAGLQLLVFLLKQPEKRATKAAIYYKNNKGLDCEPREGDKNWEYRYTWERIVDTTINRLRAVIEPDPQKPIYLISERGKGFIKLENTHD